MRRVSSESPLLSLSKLHGKRLLHRRNSTETPVKQTSHQKTNRPAQHIGKKHDLKNSDPQLPQGLMCTNEENTLMQLLVPWQESLVGFSNVSS